MNSTLSDLPGRALQLATQVGSGLKDAVPGKALHWVETGAALSALRSGSRVAVKVMRRNPVVAVAAAAGAGLLWYAAHRKAHQVRNGNGAIEGTATRVDSTTAPARRGRPRKTATERTTAARKAPARKTTRARTTH